MDRRRAQTVRAGRVLAGILLGLLAALPADASRCSKDSPARAEHLQRPRFRAEVNAAVQGDSTCALLHVEVPYSELCFRRSPEGLAAQFELIVHIYRRDRQVTGDLWPLRVTVPDRNALRSRGAYFQKDLLFGLTPGSYVFDVRLSEPTSGQEGRLCLAGHLPVRIPGRPLLSPLMFGRCALEGPLMELRQAGVLRREFTEPQDTLCAYAELYHHGLAWPGISLQWRLLGAAGQKIREGQVQFEGGKEVTALSWPLPVGDLWLNTYTVEVTATAGGYRTQAQSTLSLQAESREALARFLAESIDVLEFIAEEEELLALRTASPDERRRLWEAFWRRRDPTPESELNEFKEEFFRRVQHANRRFGVLRPGWQTDRGEVYITYGDPDEVTRDPHSANGRPMEVWFYDRIGRRFVFVDRNGYGDFELIRQGW